MRAISLLISICGLGSFLLCSACSLEPGRTWTRADITTSMIWSTDGRLNEDGDYQTAKSYQIRFTKLELTLGYVTIHTSAASSNGEFDPANPPPGYSLCHNGHCHNEAGELIDYEDIILELGGQSAAGQSLVQTIATTTRVDTSEESNTFEVDMGECKDASAMCEVGPNDIRAVDLQVNGMSLEAMVFDDGDLSEGLEINVDLDLDVVLTALLSVPLGESAKQKIGVQIDLRLQPKLWDAIDFKKLRGDDERVDLSAFQRAATAALIHGADLSVSTK